MAELISASGRKATFNHPKNRNNKKLNKAFIKQRIAIFADKDIDPAIDSEVIELLQRKFNILLPQRPTLDEALEVVIKTHEVIGLIIQYRSASKVS
jgi:hypothetical protein